MNADTTLLLGLDGLAVDHVELDADGIWVVHVIIAVAGQISGPEMCSVVMASAAEVMRGVEARLVAARSVLWLIP